MAKRKGLIVIALLGVIILTILGLFHKREAKKPKIEPVYDAIEKEMPQEVVEPDQKIDCEDMFFNAARGYQVPLPKDYELYESAGMVYFRNPSKKSQITLIYTPEAFADGIALWENASIYMDKLCGMVWDENGNATEKTLKLYGAGPKTPATIGAYEVQSEHCELWFRNTGEGENVKVDAYGYYSTFDGHGIILLGYSQSNEEADVLSDMQEVLAGLEPYETPKEQLEMEVFTSDLSDGTSFNYPENWEKSVDNTGMVIIKAPQSGTSSYAGMQIAFLADTTQSFVLDPAQFSAGAEAEVLKYTFIRPVGPYDFTYTSVVTLMDEKAKLGQKDAIYYEVEDTLYPDAKDVRNAVGYTGLKVESIRYAYSVGNTPCMINFICPNEASKELAKELIQTIQTN